MKKQKNNLDAAINALKNEIVPPCPPQETIDTTLQKLMEAESGTIKSKITITERIKAMKSFTKLAAAAMIIIAVLLPITFLDKSVTPAYALEQTIEATRALRYLHTKYFHGERDDVAKECWLEFDESGRTKNLRINWSDWFAGGKVVVWNENETKIWNQKENLLTIFSDEVYTSRVHKMKEGDDPKLIVEQLYEQEAKGLVKIEIDESGNKEEPIVVTATYLPDSPKYGDRKVLFVDRGTNLTTRMELYVLKQGEYTYYGVIEYFDYNVPIDEQMFSLADEVPADATRIDTRTHDLGLAQGELADKEIAAKVIREFLEALIAEDYATAGQLWGGLAAAEVHKRWGKLKVVRIVSIGEPGLAKPSKVFPKMQTVPYTIEIEKDGKTAQQQLKWLLVRPVLGRRDRWVIH